MARDSRPPGFDMSFRPEEPQRFGPPLRTRLPSYGYLLLTACFVFFVAYGHIAPPGSLAYQYALEPPEPRPFTPATIATVVLLSGIAAVLRTHMRGVRVLPDGIEFIDVLALGLPKVRLMHWAMIDKFRFDSTQAIAIELWNGTFERLPEVEDRAALVETLRFIAEARAIPYVPPADE